MYTLLKQLTAPLGVSGREDGIRRTIERMIEPYVDEVSTDALGNLIAHKRGGDGAQRLMLAAHMDEIGFYVTDADENGMVRFSNAGGIHYDAVLYDEVVFENGTRGVIVPATSEKASSADSYCVDIGAKSRADALRRVSTGDTFAVEKSLRRLSGGRITGRPIDDRIGCAILIEAARRADVSPYDVYYVFTVQEEVGCRGSRTAAFGIMPDIAVAVDVTGTGDTPTSPKMAVKLGGGAAIKIKDNSVISDPALVKRITEIAKARGIKYQLEILTRGGTDTSSMQAAGAGCSAGCISVPTRYCHTPHEMIDLSDAEACVSLALGIIEG